MNQLDIQNPYDYPYLPTQAQFQLWVDAALADFEENTEIVIRIVNETESADLNERYRHKNGPTNILSFPADVPENIDLDLLGDLVVCAPVVESEAQLQHKPALHHWAHMIIHGVLHLLGYDHIEPDDAEEMESKEIAILNTLTIPNPYTEVDE